MRIEALKAENDKLKLIYDQRNYSSKRRENNPTTVKMITERRNRTRLKKKQETKSVLNYIHGGTSNAVLGAWDFVQTNSSRELMDQFVTGYRKGKFIQDKFNDITMKYESSDESLKKAVALKY